MIASSTEEQTTIDNTVIPSKPPLPTFADAPRVEGELIIIYSEGQEFENLSDVRQAEITAFLEEQGAISQEKAYEVSEGPLAGSYILKFRSGIDIEAAAQQIYQLPEIENAQPNIQFEPY